MFDVCTKKLSLHTFERSVELVALALNYNPLHSWDVPDPRSEDKCVLVLLYIASERMAVAAGLQAILAENARARVEEIVTSRRFQEARMMDSASFHSDVLEE